MTHSTTAPSFLANASHAFFALTSKDSIRTAQHLLTRLMNIPLTALQISDEVIIDLSRNDFIVYDFTQYDYQANEIITTLRLNDLG